jgi:dolichyl-phosphate beta-glucosyltransferase
VGANTQKIEKYEIRDSVDHSDIGKRAYPVCCYTFYVLAHDTIMVTDKGCNKKYMSIVRSIVVPAYAEATLIKGTIEKIHESLAELGWLESTEVIFVTADATDGTVGIVEESIKVFPSHKHIKPGPRVGKGRDVKAGLSASTGDFVLFMDADLATPLLYVSRVFALLEENGGMVIGVRSIKTMHKTFSRRTSSFLSNALIRSIIGWNIADSQCGFKGFDRSTVATILDRSRIQGWGFDFEFIKIAKLHKIRITSILIPDWHDPKQAGMGLAGDSPLLAMKQTLMELVSVMKNQSKGLYK